MGNLFCKSVSPLALSPFKENLPYGKMEPVGVDSARRMNSS